MAAGNVNARERTEPNPHVLVCDIRHACPSNRNNTNEKRLAVFKTCKPLLDLVAKGGIQTLADFAVRLSVPRNLVAKGGIEPPTHGFSVRCSTN